MFNNFNPKRILIVIVGLGFFVIANLFSKDIPFLGNPKLPVEIKTLIGYLGFSENDLSIQIKKYKENQNINLNSKNLYKVTKIIDGDTIEIEGNQLVRYIGIDTPEKYSNITKAECWNQEATERNMELVLNKEVRLEQDVSETDKYGRLLRYVYVDEVFVNGDLVEKGFALHKSYPPDISKNRILADLQSVARDNKIGLWGNCN